ncbi:MAG TPA: ABC transporter permease subunit [Acidimicrobiales bacterium]|nr:ABC transporter permease subunit [Acidimicrobiales bacterium]
MALRSVFAKTVYDRRHGLLWWNLGIGVMTVATMSVWPSVRDEYAKLVENYPTALLAFFGIDKAGLGTSAGYLQAELFSLLVPLAFIAYMIAGASSTIAGEREVGTLELLLAQPVSRPRIASEKFLGLCASLAVIAGGFAVVVVVFSRVFDLRVGAVDIVAATASAYLLAVLFGAAALLAGCLTGHRAFAAGLAAVVAGAAYLLTSLGSLVSGIRRFRPASPFWWYSGHDPLRHGLEPLHVALLVGVTLVLFALALVAFERRDAV